jgi:hypothetical protein
MDFEVVILNSGDQEIEDAHVEFDDFVSVGGIIVPRALTAHVVRQTPIPESALVRWKSLDGKSYKRIVEVRSKVPEAFRSGGSLVFEIDGENRVVFRTEPPFEY